MCSRRGYIGPAFAATCADSSSSRTDGFAPPTDRARRPVRSRSRAARISSCSRASSTASVERLRTIERRLPDRRGRTHRLLADTCIAARTACRFLESAGAARRTAARAARQLSELRRSSASGCIATPAADAILDRLATSDATATCGAGRRRSSAAIAARTASRRSSTLIETERRSQSTRGTLVERARRRRASRRRPTRCWRSRRRDADPKIRAEAVYWVPDARGHGRSCRRDASHHRQGRRSTASRQRAVSGLARLPNDDGVPDAHPARPHEQERRSSANRRSRARPSRRTRARSRSSKRSSK